MERAVVACALLAGAAVGAPAHAQPSDVIERPLGLAPGELDARLVTEIGLALREAGNPIALAPDVWYGVASRWTVGLTHSFASAGRFAAGTSFCVRGDEQACHRIYLGSTADVRWAAREGRLAVAPRARLMVRDVDPVKPALALGALVRWRHGRFALGGDPYLRIGLASRDLGNRDLLALPVWLGLQPARGWLLALRTGWDAELAVARDGWRVPIGIAITARATAALDLALEAGFPALLGPQNNVKQRALAITIGWRGELTPTRR